MNFNREGGPESGRDGSLCYLGLADTNYLRNLIFFLLFLFALRIEIGAMRVRTVFRGASVPVAL